MFDRIIYRWIPALFLVLILLILIPSTSAPILRFVQQILMWYRSY
ncbi:MAG: hypothetical protein ACYC35_07540 [Pirellulales bacterium]